MKKTSTRALAIIVLAVVYLAVGQEKAQAFKKQAFPQLSVDQRQRLDALHPGTTSPVYVTVRLHVMRGDVTDAEIVQGCGLADVDQVARHWAWTDYHYTRSFTGTKEVKVHVNPPIIQDPAPHFSWRAWAEIRKFDIRNEGKNFLVKMDVVIRNGQIVDVQVLKSSGSQLVDQECRDNIRGKWVAAPGANQDFQTSVSLHRKYYGS